MLRLLSDEDVNGAILRGLRRRGPDFDLVLVHEVDLDNTPDAAILEWAAAEGRVLITADVNTMVGFACRRVEAGEPMPGILALRPGSDIGRAIEDILIAAECYTAEEMKDQIVFIPL